MLKPITQLIERANRPKTIRFEIVSLVAIILIPLVAVITLLAVNFANTKRQLIEVELVDVAGQVTTMADREIANTVGMLLGLATSGDLVTGELADFKKHAAALATRPRIVQVWAFSKNGKTVSAARPDQATAVDPDVIRRVFAGHRVVSTVRGEGLKDATVVVAVPVIVDDRVVFGVAAEIHIDYLSKFFAAAGLNEDWAAAIVDVNGRYVARSLDAERRVGQLARPELGEAARRANETGAFDNVTYEGVSVHNAFRRSPLTGWTTVIAVPKAALTAPLRRYIAYLSLGGATILLLTLILASAQAARIAEPVRNLSRSVIALVEGRKFPEAKHRIYELDEVRLAFERAIAHSAHLSALVASSGDAIMSVGLDGNIKTWNAGAEALFGYSAKEIIGQPKTLLVPQDEREEFQRQRAEVLSGRSVRAETVRLRRDGTRVDVSLNLAPIRGSSGEITAISSIIHDISKRKAIERQLQFLMRELSHRSKNQLAIVQAIAGQMAQSANSVDEFMSRFRTRLQGLAASHDLLISRDWTGVALADLVRRQIETFADTLRENIEIAGPALHLTASATEAIGLALHELATNSAKYGALSVPNGRLKVAWSLEPTMGEPAYVVLKWSETEGPPVRPPTKKGFGSLVIERMVAAAVNGKVRLEFAPTGLYWRLEFPCKHLVELDCVDEQRKVDHGIKPAPKDNALAG
ncbi:MAG: PAS domain S-box protein [Rhodoplanes sp.]